MAYFPNGSSGEVLDEQCEDCPLGYGWSGVNQECGPCPTALVHLMLNYEQCKNPDLASAMRYLVADNGECQTRKLLLKLRDENV